MWRDSVVRIQAQHRRTAWNSAIWWKEGGNSKSSTSWQRRVLGVAGMRCAGELATLFKQPIPRTCLAILRGRHGPVRRSVPSCNTVVSLWFRTRAARPIRVLCSLAVTWSPQKFRAFDSGGHVGHGLCDFNSHIDSCTRLFPTYPAFQGPACVAIAPRLALLTWPGHVAGLIFPTGRV